MQYLETPPSPRFADLITCFWSLEDAVSGAREPEPVIPDGCVEIIFNLADRFRRYHSSGAVETQEASLIAGQMLRSILIGPSGKVLLFGIRFKPAGAFPFFRFAMKDLADRVESLRSVWGSSVSIIEEQLASANSFQERVAIAESILVKRLSDKHVFDPWLRNAIELISNHNGKATVSRIARDLCISERGLERKFRQSVGLTPKMFSRIVRFQRVLKAIEHSPNPDIIDKALAFGYCDQSHLIHDFQQFSGKTPTAFLSRPYGITDAFLRDE